VDAAPTTGRGTPRREIPWRSIALASAASFILLFTLAVVAGFDPEPAPTPDIASPVDGAVIAVDATGLTQVRGFTLRPTGVPSRSAS
jgi:hypothetical protein